MFEAFCRVMNMDHNFFEMLGEVVAEAANDSDLELWDVRETILKGFDARAEKLDDRTN